MEAIIIKNISGFLYVLFNEKPEYVALAVLNFATYFYYSRAAAKKMDKMWDLIRKNEVSIGKHENRLQMQSDHFDVLDKDCERSKKHAHNAVLFCYQILKDLGK